MIAHRISNVFGEPHQLVCIFFKILNMHKFELKKNWKNWKTFNFWFFFLWIIQKNKILKAIHIQAAPTQGDNLSPILANFQKVPIAPVLFLSMMLGKTERR